MNQKLENLKAALLADDKLKKTSSLQLSKKYDLDFDDVSDLRLSIRYNVPFEEIVDLRNKQRTTKIEQEKETLDYRIPEDKVTELLKERGFGENIQPRMIWIKDKAKGASIAYSILGKPEESIEDQVNDIDWEGVIERVQNSVVRKNPTKVPVHYYKQKTQIVCISDVHCGMETEGWNREIMMDRFQSIVESCQGGHVEIMFLGDGVDGLDATTTRKGHSLPQNMNNQEQILNLTEAFMLLFEGLYQRITEGKIGSIGFSSVYESNHSGDMDYVVAKFLSIWLKQRFPSITTNITKDIWGRFNVGDFSFYFTHGKDAKDQKRGFPIDLNPQVENYISHILRETFPDFRFSPSKDIVVSGDLHTQSFSQGKFLKYYKVPAMSPSSGFCKANYGNSIPGVQYFSITGNVLETGVIEF